MKPFERQSIYKDSLEAAFQSIQIEEEVSIAPVVSQATHTDCEKKFNDLLSENKRLLRDNKALKKLLSDSKSVILQKEMKIKKLQLQLHNSTNTDKNIFEQYVKYFTSSQMIELRSMPQGERKDSTFVTKCMDYLYGGKHNLIDRVATNVKVPAGKKPISPEKIKIISGMLQERLNSEDLSDELSSHRFSRLNMLLNNAICTARKIQNPVSSSIVESHLAPNATQTTPNTSKEPMSNTPHQANQMQIMPNTSNVSMFNTPYQANEMHGTYQQTHYAPIPQTQHPYPYMQYDPVQQMLCQHTSMSYQHPQYSLYTYPPYTQPSTAQNFQFTNL